MADVVERAEYDAREAEEKATGRDGQGSRGSEKGQAAGAPGKKNDKKTGLLVALTGAGLVVAYLTYRAISGGGSSSSTAASPSSSANNPANYPASGGDVAGSTAGDPNAGAGFDLMLSNLEAQIGALQTSVSAIPTTTPSSTSSGTTAPAFKLASGLHYIQEWQSGAIYQVESDGSVYHLSPQQWAEIRNVDPTAPKRVTQYGPPKPAAKPAAKK